MHDKKIAKKPENRDNPQFIGCLIDQKLRDMANGQTNGIPQGSVLMDFIAEIILGYADMLLSQKLSEANIQDYYIIRYRDDYRIFVNNPTVGDAVTKYLTEVLIELGLKLNSTKTSSSRNIILGSIKKDKLDLTTSLLGEKYLNNDSENIKHNNQRLLLQIYDFAYKHPNSGQLKRILAKFYEKMEMDCKKDDMGVLISIAVDLAYNNPSTYNLCAAIISKIIECVSNNQEKINYIEKISKKFEKLPNTGFMDIWLQRISYKISPSIQYKDKLCQLISNQKGSIWNSEWLTGKIKKVVDKCQIVDYNIIEKMSPLITQKEVDAFHLQSDSSDFGEDPDEI